MQQYDWQDVIEKSLQTMNVRSVYANQHLNHAVKQYDMSPVHTRIAKRVAITEVQISSTINNVWLANA